MRKKSRRKKSRRKRKFCHKDVTYELHKAQKEISRLKRNNKDLIQHYQQENNQLRQQLENCKQKNTHLLFNWVISFLKNGSVSLLYDGEFSQ